MRQRRLKLQEEMQRLLTEKNGIEGQIAQLQNQIDQLETLYLQRTWCQGNVYIGWSKAHVNNAPTNLHTKINIDPKQKLFSLSSIASPAFAQLGTNVDRQLSPYGESRFESKKKKKSKKKSSNQMRRPRPIRKKKRR